MRKPFEKIFDEASLLPKIRRSIYLMTLGNTFGTLWGVISGGGSSSLTGYAGYLGAGDFVYGLLTAIPLAAALLQIPFATLVSRTQKRKKYMITYGLFSRLLWIIIGLIPFFIPASQASLRLWSVILLIGVSSSFSSFINVSWMPWMADLVPIEIRGRWLSKRDGITSVASVTMGLLVAGILDQSSGFTGYTIVFVMCGILGALDMVCFGFMEDVYKTPPVQLKLLPVLKQIFQNKPFFKFMLFWTAWSFTANMSGAYLARYALTEMGLSYMQFALSSQVTAAAITVLVVTHWGRLLDHFGSKPVLWCTCVFAALTPLFFLFSTYGSIWPTLLHNLIGAAFWSGANLAATSLQLSSSPDEQRPSYIAVFSCITSLFGSFLGILTGGAILEGIHNSTALSTIIPDRYKFIIAISVLLRIASVFIIIPMLDNNSSHTLSGMFTELSLRIKVQKSHLIYRWSRRRKH
ncbi:MAG: major facilitator superfamily protein [Herbinix sp.]|jgi:MFS family permease|nr:major facilitator superfamily protein [Herbinix sp.]